MKIKIRLASSILRLALIVLSGAAGAAPTADTSSVTVNSNGNDNLSLQEIVVTATRREESVEKVPISINALSQAELTQGGIKSITDLAAVTPGLQFAAPTGFASTLTTIAIRGLNTITGASVVGIYLDDTPIQSRLSGLTNIGSAYPVVFDLNRVEVERGPQGTLFGAGSEAGTVRFITNQPSLTQFSGFSHAELAMTQNGGPSYEIGAAAGGPIVEDRVGFRVSVWDRQDGGYVNLIDPLTRATVESNANRNDKLALKAALSFQANEDVRITPSVYYQSGRGDDSGYFYANFSKPSQGQFNNGRLLPEVSTDHFVLPSIKLEAHLSFAELTSTTSFMDRRANASFDESSYLGAVGLVNYGSPLGPAFPTSLSDVAPQFDVTTVRGFTEEVRLASNRPEAFLTWVAGLFYDHRSQRDFQTASSIQVDPTGKEIYEANQLFTDDQIAAFAQTYFHLTSKLTATLGERVAKVKSGFVITNGTGVYDPVPSFTQSTVKETPSTPLAALSFQASSNNLFYISAGKGFRVGGGNEVLPTYCNFAAPNTYKSDYVWSYEVGAKNTLFDGKVQIDSSAFRINWSKIQSLITLPCGAQYTDNTGSAVSKGFDLALQALVTSRLRVNLDIGYVNAYFSSNVFNDAGAPLVLAGEKIGYLPQVNAPWNVNTSANYEIPLPHGEKIYLRGEYQYNSRNPGPFNTQVSNSPSYNPQLVANPPTHLFNAKVGAKIEKVDVMLFVNNVFNSHPLLSKYTDYSATSNLFNYTTLRPRTVGLSANVEF